MKSYTTNRGFTILELIVYMGLLGSFLVVMSQIFIATFRLKIESESTSYLEQDATLIMQRLAYDIRRAYTIATPALGSSGSSVVITATDSGTLKTYTYSWSGGVLSLSDGTYTDRLHSNRSTVSNFNVARIGNSGSLSDAKDTIRIELTQSSAYILPSGTEQMSFQTTVGIR